MGSSGPSITFWVPYEYDLSTISRWSRLAEQLFTEAEGVTEGGRHTEKEGGRRSRKASSTGARGGRKVEAVVCDTLAGFGAWPETPGCVSSGHQYLASFFLPQPPSTYSQE